MNAAELNAIVLGNAERETREHCKRLTQQVEKARSIIDKQAHEIERLQSRLRESEETKKTVWTSALRWRATAKEWLAERDKWRDLARENGFFPPI